MKTFLSLFIILIPPGGMGPLFHLIHDLLQGNASGEDVYGYNNVLLTVLLVMGTVVVKVTLRKNQQL